MLLFLSTGHVQGVVATGATQPVDVLNEDHVTVM